MPCALELADVLSARMARDHDLVAIHDDNDIAQPEDRYARAIALDQHIAAIHQFRNAGTSDCIALAITRQSAVHSSQFPMSDQSISTGTMAALVVASITA